jgi:hypothetical protein
VLLPRRWVVERSTLAWINRNGWLAKDFERSIANPMAWIMIANVKPDKAIDESVEQPNAIKIRALKHDRSVGPISAFVRSRVAAHLFVFANT